MKCLSILQPWAWAIIHGGKDVENRTWPTNHRGPLLVHASLSRKSYDVQDEGTWKDLFGVVLPPWKAMVKGAIIGRVELIDCDLVETRPDDRHAVRTFTSVWAEPDGYGFVLRNPRALPMPIPYKGRLGFYEVPDDLLPTEFR